jgi:hypothetical protein
MAFLACLLLFLYMIIFNVAALLAWSHFLAGLEGGWSFWTPRLMALRFIALGLGIEALVGEYVVLGLRVGDWGNWRGFLWTFWLLIPHFLFFAAVLFWDSTAWWR